MRCPGDLHRGSGATGGRRSRVGPGRDLFAQRVDMRPAILLLLLVTVVALLSLMAGVVTAWAQDPPVISIALSPSAHHPHTMPLSAEITLDNLDFNSYDSVVLRAEVTGHEERTRHCYGEDTGEDITVPVDESREVFSIRVFRSCTDVVGGFGTYDFDLDVSIFRTVTGQPGSRVEIGSARAEFLVSRYLQSGVGAPAPEPDAAAWMDPDPRTLEMVVHGAWTEFRFRSNILLYAEDHLGVLVNAEDAGHLATGGPESTPEEACRRAEQSAEHWRRGIHQSLWIVACKPGGAVIRLGHETAAVDPLYTYRFQTLASSSGNSAPQFAGASTTREIAENAPANSAVGAAVTATDPGDALTYTLTGSSRFIIDSSSGQIRVASDAMLDHQTGPLHTVTVTASDALNASASISVTINVVEQVTTRRTGSSGGAGGGGGPPPDPIPSDADFDWNVTRDIESLDRDNDLPTGIWSDGETLWVIENSASGADRVFAYDLKTGERKPDAEFELEPRNRFAHGIWSDGETMWIADSGQDQLFAYAIESGARVEEHDFELAERNRDPRGIWSDGVVMYVLDSVKDALFVYNFETGDLLAEHALDKLNKSPRGIWSDDVTLWVSDDGAKRLFAYEVDGEALRRNEDLEFTFRSLLKAGNGNPRGIWSDGNIMYVVDEQDHHVYTYNIPDATIAQLASLSLDELELEEFSPHRFEYAAAVAYDLAATTVAAAATQEAGGVKIEPADADGDPENGHQVTLGTETAITVTVTSADGSRRKTYVIQVSKPPCLSGLTEARLSEVAFVGGSISELEACAHSFDISALYHHGEGVYVALFLLPDLPEFLSRPFRTRFAEDLPPGELLIANRQATAATAPGAPDAN